MQLPTGGSPGPSELAGTYLRDRESSPRLGRSSGEGGPRDCRGSQVGSESQSHVSRGTSTSPRDVATQAFAVPHGQAQHAAPELGLRDGVPQDLVEDRVQIPFLHCGLALALLIREEVAFDVGVRAAAARGRQAWHWITCTRSSAGPGS